MLHRLWITDDQAALVATALRFYSRDLQSRFDGAIRIKDDEAAENINNVMLRLDDILDILTED